MSYLSEVQADSPLHYWRLADGPSNRIADIAASGRVDLWVADRNGVVPGTGIAPDGGSWIVQNGLFANSSAQTFNLPTPFSLELWCWLAVRPEVAFLLSIGPVNTAGSTELSVGSTGLPRYRTATANNSGGSGNCRDQQWHHLVMTKTSTTLIGYLDAVQVLNIADAAVGPNNTVTIAGQGTGIAMAEVALYGSALSPTRINAHFLAGNTPQPSPTPRQLAGTTALSDITDILNAVRKTYSNS